MLYYNKAAQLRIIINEKLTLLVAVTEKTEVATARNMGCGNREGGCY
jgi:hypothetical protein